MVEGNLIGILIDCVLFIFLVFDLIPPVSGYLICVGRVGGTSNPEDVALYPGRAYFCT